MKKTATYLSRELSKVKAERDVFRFKLANAEEQLADFTGCNSPYVLREVMDSEVSGLRRQYMDDIHRLIQRLR